jgi:hypothetical protein
MLNRAGWKARKRPAMEKYFFLTFPLKNKSGLGREGRDRLLVTACDCQVGPGFGRLAPSWAPMAGWKARKHPVMEKSGKCARMV